MKVEAIYRLVAVSIMCAAFFAQTFNTFFIVADYYSNTQAFAQHCENKSRPELHCNGKCQMIKKINREEKKDQQNPERRNNKNEVIAFSRSNFSFPSPFLNENIQHYPSIKNGEEIKMPRSLLRPPIA